MLKRTVLALALATATPAAATTYTGEFYDVLGDLSSIVTSCTKNAQCIVVDSLPCGCAEGGTQVAINASYRQFWNALRADARTLPIACAQVYRCKPRPKAFCVLGHCTTSRPSTDTLGILPPSSRQ